MKQTELNRYVFFRDGPGTEAAQTSLLADAEEAVDVAKALQAIC